MFKQPVTVSPRVAFLSVAAALTSACSVFGNSSPAEPTGPGTEPVAVAAAPPAPARDPALEQRLADLELDLYASEIQVRELQARLDDARLEVVRAMAKLQSLATRAEAASGMAEAELALQALPAGDMAESAAEASSLLGLSVAEFDKQNYGGALYLADQAKAAAAVARVQLEGADTRQPRPGEQAFSLPLPFETTTGANVRNGPGLNFNVLFVLPAGAVLTAHSSTEQWLRVTDDAGRRGWISQGLIRQRPLP